MPKPAKCPSCGSKKQDDRWCAEWKDITRPAERIKPHVYEPELGCVKCPDSWHSQPDASPRIPCESNSVAYNSEDMTDLQQCEYCHGYHRGGCHLKPSQPRCGEQVTRWELHEYCIRPKGHDYAHSSLVLRDGDYGRVRGDAPTPGHSREDYEACLEYARKNNYRSMYNSMAEDGYDPTVNWRALMKDAPTPERTKLDALVADLRDHYNTDWDTTVPGTEFNAEIKRMVLRHFPQLEGVERDERATIQLPDPDGFAHEYPDGIRYGTGGRTINGSAPLKTIRIYYESTVRKLLEQAGKL